MSRSRDAAGSALGSSLWLTADEAVSHLRLPSRKALYQAVRRGRVPVHRLGRSLRFNRAILDQMLLGQTSALPRG